MQYGIATVCGETHIVIESLPENNSEDHKKGPCNTESQGPLAVRLD